MRRDRLKSVLLDAQYPALPGHRAHVLKKKEKSLIKNLFDGGTSNSQEGFMALSKIRDLRCPGDPWAV